MLTADTLPVDRRVLLNPLQRRVREHRGFPVVPGAFPVIGHLPAIALDYLDFVRRAEERFGSFFWVDQGFGKLQLTCLLPEVFSILKNKVTTSTYVLDILPDLFGSALIAQDGPAHHHVRSAMNATFQPRGLAAAEIGLIFAEMIERRVRSWSSRGELQILTETRELVLSLMFRMLGAPDDELSLWRKQYEEYTLLALNVPLDLPGSPLRRGRRARAWLNERLLGFIRAARTRPDAPGLLAALVRARDEDGALLSDDELVDNLRLLVLAGHETSASTMAWIVLVLAQRPDVWERLRDEARAAGEVPRTATELRRFTFAEAVFRETLRLYPPITNNTRQTTADLELGGRIVPAGCNIAMSVVHLSRSPQLYECPDEFRPERWLDRTGGLTPTEMAQFGGGPHFCLGYHLAWLEIVQFSTALALSAGDRRPRLCGPFAGPRYLPLLHPAASTRVTFS